MYFYKWLGRTYTINRKNIIAMKKAVSPIAELVEEQFAAMQASSFRFAYAA